METNLLRELVALQREQVAALNETNSHLMAIVTHVAMLAPPVKPQDRSPSVGDNPYVVTDDGIENGLWITRREAWLHLGIVKSTLEGMVNSGELAAYHKVGDRHKKKPYVWLKRSDVEALFRSYTLRKGKEKKARP
ncbi:hypothetical protein [Parapedobacter sp. 2B3]|uniref:hypothetical protein n=1 Tax=Parapedobacter sp. 2B3 TaxID=3342381 RepID=UPI0035B677C6